ncbi:peroxiredoxin [Alkalibacter mobilis]|uniref:peroxiredoxin n=1 Tax=Alkalibacter mobilis TaxID=2787712 RepID=UPI00189E039A|nr:peroxiredoxin [Alkalibacter mobilis]MBF7096096.1 peroxiredoxin [Alkalibacter mobilis]
MVDQSREKAPGFSLKDAEGQLHKLDDYLGKKVVLYFYPKDNTSGCTDEALQFKDLYDEFKDNNTVIIGISKDSEKSHRNFIDKYDLPFILLSDPELEAIKGYDVWKLKKMYGKEYYGIVRSTFVIDEQGYIAEKFLNVKVKNHGDEVKKCILSI